MILCGRQAIDDESSNIGPMVAEFLGIPHISAVLKMEIFDGAKAKAENEVEEGRQTVEVELPALFTTQKGINEPRVPLITGVMKAMKTNIPVMDPFSLEIPRETIESSAWKTNVLFYEPPKNRPPVKMIEGETAEEKVRGLIKILKEEAKAL